jgi:hypothetical protein
MSECRANLVVLLEALVEAPAAGLQLLRHPLQLPLHVPVLALHLLGIRGVTCDACIGLNDQRQHFQQRGSQASWCEERE